MSPDSGTIHIVGYAPTVWITATWAPNWYRDAVNEARAGIGRDARRREITFAVCAAESYLVEWVRDAVLNTEFDQLSQYFPASDRDGIPARWKRVVKALVNDGRIARHQDFDGRAWQAFSDLVEWRNGLVHGLSSRPATQGQSRDLRPLPSTDTLDQLAPGEALRIVTAIVDDLHSAAGTARPAWIL